VRSELTSEVFWRYTVDDIDMKISLYFQREQIHVMQDYESMILAISALFADPKKRKGGAKQVNSVAEFAGMGGVALG